MDRDVGEKLAEALFAIAKAIREHKPKCVKCGGSGQVTVGGGFSSVRETKDPCGVCGGKGY